MKFLFAFIALTSSLAQAQAHDYHPQIHSALSFLADAQVKKKGDFYPGQWSTYVTSILFPSLVGVGTWGTPYAEPTAFDTASVANIISDMYFSDPSLKEIPPMVDKAAGSYARYYVGSLFDFYPPKLVNGVVIHNPHRMKLGKLFVGFANVPADADSSSVTYVAMNNNKLMQMGATHRELVIPVPEEVYSAFSTYRDLNRKPHFFNRYYGNFDTGAYMTWLMDEKDPNMPGSTAKPEKGPRIPFGINDVDCVVNANVLKLMTLARHFKDPGYQESCDFLKRVIDKNQQGLCAPYYPNRFEATMEIARIRELGPSCLQDHDESLLTDLLSSQKKNGSWENGPPNRYDVVQTTALALNSLLLLGSPHNPDHRARVEKAVEYLMSQARKDAKGHLYWNGEVFFSAVAQARFTIVWRSTPYTTALVTKALLLAEKF